MTVPLTRCPRCNLAVTYEAGTKPTCPVCGFPGPDSRIPPPDAVTNGPEVAVEFGLQPHRTRRDEGIAAIETRGLTKLYKGIPAVDRLTIRVPRGGVTGFVGPNGAGKTTTIRMLMGLVRPSSGSATVLGHSIAKPLGYLPRVGALIEAPAFHPHLSGRRNLEVLAILGGHDLSRIDQLLRVVGLDERAQDPFKAYSLGMKQRLGIAAALIPDPDLLVLDEPTNGLDPAGIREVRALLRRLGDAGKTVFVSSHLLSEVQKMCDHLVVLRQGRVIYQGSVEGLLAGQVGLYAAARDRSLHPRLVALAEAAGFAAEEEEGGVLVHCPASFSATLNERAMAAGIVLAELRPRAGDLEATVLELTGRGTL